MKITKVNILVLLILLTLETKAQSDKQILKTSISLHADSITKSALLDSLERKYNLHFSYNPILLRANDIVQMELKNEPLFSFLKKLINTSTLSFKAFDNQIVFFPINNSPRKEKIINNKIAKGIIFTGKKKEPIPYCNISIRGKPIGTMANTNGEFIFKIPDSLYTDTIIFSCLGYELYSLPVTAIDDTKTEIELRPKSYSLNKIDIVNYNPQKVLEQLNNNILKNYENDYALLSTFYRELTTENDEYTDISEAVMEVMKAPYSNEFKTDHVKLIKGRKGAVVKPFSDIKFTLMGGPYYITKLDVVKNSESFINPEYWHLYEYKFDGIIFIDNRETIVLNFKPINNMRNILFFGKIFIDKNTWGITRVEFNYTRQGLKTSQKKLIQKEPKKCKAIPTSLGYIVQYKFFAGKWYLLSAKSLINITIINKKKRHRTRFHNVSEILTTNIEKGNLEKFSCDDIFKSNEIFTDKIISYDKAFWKNYNIIKPEENLINALKTFDGQNLVVTYKKQHKK